MKRKTGSSPKKEKQCARGAPSRKNDGAGNEKYRRKSRKQRSIIFKLLLVTVPLAILALFLVSSTSLHEYTKNVFSFMQVADNDVKPLPWKSPIIHIVNTRFNQNQPHLTTLATARLYLFKTVCLPSILKQTSHNFLWIIKIDPDLDIVIRNELIRYINEGVEKIIGIDSNLNSSVRGRIFVIGSNANFLIGHDPGAWRGGIESKELLHCTKQIYMGDIDLLRSANYAEPDRIVLETRLDADDGLHAGYIRHIQDDALKKFGVTPDSVNSIGDISVKDNTGKYFRWFYWCTKSHLKWYIHGSSECGQLDFEEHSNVCVTPGLTVGFNIGTNLEDVPTSYAHHDLLKELRKQQIFSCKGVDRKFDQPKKHQCATLVSDFVAAIRSRSVTSTGMFDVNTRKDKSQEKLWAILDRDFGISIDDAIETKTFFQENVKEIAEENLKGQCKPGHSCKEDGQVYLKAIIKAHERTK